VHRRNLHFSLSNLLKACAVRTLADLISERPTTEQRSERCHVVQSSLKRLFSLVLFLLAALKHKDLQPIAHTISQVARKSLLKGVVDVDRF